MSEAQRHRATKLAPAIWTTAGPHTWFEPALIRGESTTGSRQNLLQMRVASEWSPTPLTTTRCELGLLQHNGPRFGSVHAA